ncbi:MAG: GIDE domain-containing protein [Myxococcales bacterium]|jgi:hypothetical protein
MEALLLLIAAVIAALVSVGARLGQKELRACRRSTCAEASPEHGRVKVSGTARCAQPLVSPLRQIPCIFYALTIYRRGERNLDDGRDSNELYMSSRLWANWWIEDDSGQLEVDGEGADVVTGSIDIRPLSGRARARRTDQILRDYGVPEDFWASYSVSEEVIPVDSEVFVCGKVKRTPHGNLMCGGNKLLVSMVPEKALLARGSAVSVVAAALAGAALLGALVLGMEQLDDRASEQPVLQEFQPHGF